MDTYSALLERTRTPQPSLQRHAVIHLFQKLRSSPQSSGVDSEAGIEAIAQCLRSTSPAVVDQSVRELCRLVKDSQLGVDIGLLELQSSLDGCDARFAEVFVKGIGFIVRVGFQRDWFGSRRVATEGHPFVKVLSCEVDVGNVLVQEVLIFVSQCRHYGMRKVCEFLRPLLTFTILRIPFLESRSYSFIRCLVSSLASLSCTFPSEAMPLLMLLNSCLRYCQCKRSEDLKEAIGLAEFVIDAYIVVLRHLVVNGTMVHEAQLCGLEVLEALLSTCGDFQGHSIGCEFVISLSWRLLGVQKDLGLQYVPGFSALMLSLFVLITTLEFEHEQLNTLGLLSFLLSWKLEDESLGDEVSSELSEELLNVFPTIHLMSSPSKSLKGAASDLLLLLGKLSPIKSKAPKTMGFSVQHEKMILSKRETIIHRLLQHLWSEDLPSTSFFLNISSISDNDIQYSTNGSISWVSQVRTHAMHIVERRKSSLSNFQSQEIVLTEMPLLVSALIGSLIFHQSLGSSAAEALSALGILEPKLGVTLLLAVLYYHHLFRNTGLIAHDMLLKLLLMIPYLATHAAMVPLVVQTINPMLQHGIEPVLYATATRLLCKSWEITDQIFGSLLGVLVPERFSGDATERSICLSMAASLRDVCQASPERGVDLILCVSASIESSDPLVKVLGFQSLGHLCEADVVDFYTAWSIISKKAVDYTADPIVASGLCLLLRWGAMDAKAHPEASKNILQILWSIGTSNITTNQVLWAKARASAFISVNHFEIDHIESSIPNVKESFMGLLIQEANRNVLQAMEALGSNIIAHEHSTRSRFVREKRTPKNKVEKLLHVFLQLIFSSGKDSNFKELPGAALLCGSFSSGKTIYKKHFKNSYDVLGQYATAMKEISISLQLSRNVVIALLSLQSWKPFMQHWLRAYLSSLDKDVSSDILDKTSAAADNILKTVLEIVDGSIPRSAENMALAVGALCAVLPPSVHAAKVTASKYLLNCLFQYEHEHHQWSAAISLGLVTSSLHVADHQQKLENINGLIQVVQHSKSALVQGACGIGLGFSCQYHFTQASAFAATSAEGTFNMLEAELLGKIVRTLSLTISQLTGYSSNILQQLMQYTPLASDSGLSMIASESVHISSSEREEDVWGVAGVIMGLGSCIYPLYRAGSYDAVSNIRSLLMSWITGGNSKIQCCSSSIEIPMALLTAGSCLAMPSVVSFFQKVELLQDNELDELLVCYKEIVSHLLCLKTSDNIHQSLLIVSCVGAGNLMACVLNEGSHFVETNLVKEFFLLLKKVYTSSYPHIVPFGGMLGVVNMIGAGVGLISHDNHVITSFHPAHETKESSRIMGPLLSNPALEMDLTSLLQDIFLVAQNSDDHKIQECATWALCFVGLNKIIQKNESAGFSASVSDNSFVSRLFLWLVQLDYSKKATLANVSTVATVVRCLSRAPRLPLLDWGAIIRRCMRYEDQVLKILPLDPDEKGTLRQECLQFSLIHANKVDALMSLVKELSDLSRFRTLDLNLQCVILHHIADLSRLFSTSGLEKLLSDIGAYFSSPISPYHDYNGLQKSMLRMSCWKGLCQSLGEASSSSALEKCMSVLFTVMPGLSVVSILEKEAMQNVEEWKIATRCLGKSRKDWLLALLQVSEVDLLRRDDDFIATQNKICLRAWLVRSGSLPLTELGKLKAYILDTKPQGMWDVLVEFTSALKSAKGSIKRQWLVDVMQISCVTEYPSTALQFLSLLSGSCCKYAPFLILDPTAVLSDLPVTLPSLLSSPKWSSIAETAVSFLWMSMERIYEWATYLACGSAAPGLQLRPIDKSENGMADFLMRVMHETCFSLREYLPLEKQLRLADMDPH